MPNANLKLTKQSVEAIPAPATGLTIRWDADLSGFGVRVSATGRRTYFLQARTRAGREIKFKLGKHGNVTAEQARGIAKVHLGKIAEGADPAEDRRRARKDEAERQAIPTVAQLCDRYIEEHAELHKRAGSVEDDKSMINRIIKPRLGTKRVPDIEPSHIDALKGTLRAKPPTANRVLALLSKVFSLAVLWGLRSDNPVKGVKRFDEVKRERYLTADELRRLTEALARHGNQTAANAIRLLLLTGARRSEVLGATWDQFDLKDGVWTKPSAHTKQKKDHHVPLSAAARQLLAEMRRDPSGFLFPGRGIDGPMAEIKTSWASVCKAAGIEGVRVHDLRHSYASLLAGAGVSLPIIGALLGHTQAQTTMRYAHLADTPQREATERVGALLSAIGKGGPSAEVIPHPAAKAAQ